MHSTCVRKVLAYYILYISYPPFNENVKQKHQNIKKKNKLASNKMKLNVALIAFFILNHES